MAGPTTATNGAVSLRNLLLAQPLHLPLTPSEYPLPNDEVGLIVI